MVTVLGDVHQPEAAILIADSRLLVLRNRVADGDARCGYHRSAGILNRTLDGSGVAERLAERCGGREQQEDAQTRNGDHIASIERLAAASQRRIASGIIIPRAGDYGS